MPTVMEVTVQGTYFNQQCLNVFNYVYDGVESDPGGLSLSLLSGMGWSEWNSTDSEYPASSMAAQWHAIASASYTFEIVTVRNVYSLYDFTEWLFPFGGASAVGQSGGEAMSPVSCYGFQSSKVRSDIKRGARRIVGVSELNVGSGGVLTPTGAAIANDLAVAFSLSLPAGLGNFVPAIVKKKKEPVLNPDGTESGRFKYVYYPTPAEQIVNVAAPVTYRAVNTVRTQTSRQYGRGR